MKYFFLTAVCLLPLFAWSQYVPEKPRPPVLMFTQLNCDVNMIWTGVEWSWDRSANAYVWNQGKCIPRRAGYVYRAGYWEHTPKGWIWLPGQWQKAKKIY
ncbi:MAG: hypothetical protein EAZ89_13685 [Bacteroidetes bacterium]|nr:MAG: hypothetical protein EAZ89_13685 [Bacteroidota bacterium]